MISEQQQRHLHQPLLPPAVYQASQTLTKLYLRMKFPQTLSRYLQTPNMKQFIVKDTKSAGKNKQIKFSIIMQQKIFIIEVQKHYFIQILNTKKYQILMMVRNFQTIIQDFTALSFQIVGAKKKQWQVVNYDILSLTIEKDYTITNCKGQTQIKRLYLKMSPFLFRKNFYIKAKECQQFFAGVIRTVNKQTSLELPTNQQYFKAHRLPFLDDMYSNQSFIKRFPTRFYTFYQAYSLLYGVPLDHRYIKQYYQKCASKSIISTMRLKKLTFHIKMPIIMQKQKQIKSTLVFYCNQDQRQRQRQKQRERLQKQKQLQQNPSYKTKQPQKQYPIKSKQTQFLLQIIPDTTQHSQKNSTLISSANTQAFIRHLQPSINNIYDNQYIKIITQSNIKYFTILNQIGFCRIFCQYYFFIQRIMFKNLKINKQNISSNYKDPSINFKLPTSQQFIGKKYAYKYQIQIKSSYNYNNSFNTMQEYKNKISYENIFNCVIMLRRKVAKDIANPTYQSIQFLATNDVLRGLTCYINQVLKKWSVTDATNDIVNFVANYLNIVVDKTKERQKNYYKTHPQWKLVIDQLSALIQAITKSLSSPDTTVILYFLRTYEDFPKDEEITKLQITQGQQVMLLTFKLLRITTAGWLEVIPSCQYFFQMQKEFTYLYKQGDKQKEYIGINKSKEHIQRIFRGYLKRTLKKKVQLPPPAYFKL